MHDHHWSKLRAGAMGAMAALALAACNGNADDAATVPEGDEATARDDNVAIPVMGPERRIVAFGDSLFAGFGLKDADGDSYPSKLEAALRAKGINAKIANAGVSGDTTAGGARRISFVLDAQEEKPDLFILELGANDALRRIAPEETRANMKAMLEELKKREIPVLLMGLRAPANLGPEYQQAFDSMYTDLAKEYNAALIPFWLEDIYQDASLFQADRIHPTEEGIEALVASTLDAVNAALPKDE